MYPELSEAISWASIHCADLFPIDDRSFEERREPWKLTVSVVIDLPLDGDRVNRCKLRDAGIIVSQNRSREDLGADYIQVRRQQEIAEWTSRTHLSLKLDKEDGTFLSGYLKAEMLARLLLGLCIHGDKRSVGPVGSVVRAFLLNQKLHYASTSPVKKLLSEYKQFEKENGPNPEVDLAQKVAQQLIKWAQEEDRLFLSTIDGIDKDLAAIKEHMELLQNKVDCGSDLDLCKESIPKIRKALNGCQNTLILKVNTYSSELKLKEVKMRTEKILEFRKQLKVMLEKIEPKKGE